jgi:hypothetical protein
LWGTCRFGERAKQIKTKVYVNETLSPQELQAALTRAQVRGCLVDDCPVF